MKTMTAVVATLILVSSAAGQSPPEPPSAMTVRGIFIKTSAGWVYKSASMKLIAGEEFRTKQPILVSVQRQSEDGYFMIVGPSPDTEETSIEVDWDTDPSDTEIEVTNGFVYLIGTRPYARSSRSIASSSGTRYIFNNRAGEDYVVLIEVDTGDEVEVESESNGQTKSLDTADTYIKVDGSGRVENPKSLPSTGYLDDLVDDCKALAEAAPLIP